MKKILLLFSLLLFLQPTFAQQPDSTTSTVSFPNLKLDATYVVGSENLAVFDGWDKVLDESLKEAVSDTLPVDARFRIVEIVSVKKFKRVKLELADGRKVFCVNPKTIYHTCYLEGESATTVNRYAFMTRLLKFSQPFFWYVFGIALAISLLFIYTLKYIDNLFYRLSGKNPHVFKTGYLFIFTSMLLGALTGLSIFAFDPALKEYFMTFPTLMPPAGQEFIFMFYWMSQTLFLFLFAWAVFRSIREFGTTYGILRSIIFFIAGLALFWTSAITSILAIVFIIFSGMLKAITTNTSGSRTYNTTLYNSVNGPRNAEVTVDSTGKITGYRNI